MVSIVTALLADRGPELRDPSFRSVIARALPILHRRGWSARDRQRALHRGGDEDVRDLKADSSISVDLVHRAVSASGPTTSCSSCSAHREALAHLVPLMAEWPSPTRSNEPVRRSPPAGGAAQSSPSWPWCLLSPQYLPLDWAGPGDCCRVAVICGVSHWCPRVVAARRGAGHFLACLKKWHGRARVATRFRRDRPVGVAAHPGPLRRRLWLAPRPPSCPLAPRLPSSRPSTFPTAAPRAPSWARPWSPSREGQPKWCH